MTLRLTQTFKFQAKAWALGEWEPRDGYVWTTIFPGLISDEYAKEIMGDYYETALANGLLVREAPERSEA